MGDSTVKTLTVNKEIFLRPHGGGRPLKLSAVSEHEGPPSLLVNDLRLNNVAPPHPSKVNMRVARRNKGVATDENHTCVDDTGLSPRVGKNNLIQGICKIKTMCVTDKSYIFLTPSSRLPPKVISGDLTVSSISPGIGFTIESIDPVEQCIVDTDTREFSWFVVN